MAINIPTVERRVDVDTQRVSNPADFQRTPVAASFGEFESKALLAEAFGKVGDIFRKRQQEQYKQQQGLIESQAYNQQMLDTNELLYGNEDEEYELDGEKKTRKSGVLNRLNEEAFNATADFSMRYHKRASDRVSKIADPETKMRVAQRISDNFVNLQSKVSQHEVQQRRSFGINTHKGTLALIVDQAGTAQSPKEFEDYLKNAYLEQAAMDDIDGLPKEMKEVNKKGVAKEIITSAINGSFNTDPTGTAANKILSDYKDELSNEDYQSIEKHMVERKAQLEKIQESARKESLVKNRFDFISGAISGNINLQNSEEHISRISTEDPDLALVIKNLVTTDFQFLPESGKIEMKDLNKIEILTDIFNENDREAISNYLIDYLKGNQGKVGRDELSAVLVAAKAHADAQLANATPEQKEDDNIIIGLFKYAIQNTFPGNLMKMFTNFMQRSGGKTGEGLKSSAMDAIIDEKIKQAPSFSTMPKEQAIKKIQEEEQQNRDEKIKNNLSFDFNRLNPFGVTQAEAGVKDNFSRDEQGNKIKIEGRTIDYKKEYDKLSMQEKVLSGAFGNWIVDFASGGMSLQEADDLRDASLQSLANIPGDLFYASKMIGNMLVDDIKHGAQFLSDPIGFVNKSLSIKSKEDIESELMKYDEGKKASLRLLGRIIKPIGRVIEGTRALTGETIDITIEALGGDEVKVSDVLGVFTKGVRGILKPEEVDTMISRIPLNKWEREGSTKIGSIVRLSPRAIFEAVETIVIAELTLGLPSNFKSLKGARRDKVIEDSFNHARNSPRARDEIGQYISSRGNYVKGLPEDLKPRIAVKQVGGQKSSVESMSYYDDFDRLVDDTINMMEIRVRKNPLLMKKIADQQKISDILFRKLNNEVGQMRALSKEVLTKEVIDKGLITVAGQLSKVSPDKVENLNNIIKNSEVPDVVKNSLLTNNEGRELTENELFIQEWAVKNFDRAVEFYLAESIKHYGSDNVITADIGKHSLPGDNQGNSASYHETGSSIKEYISEILHNDPNTKHLPAGAMAGGPGVGKTSIVRSISGNFKEEFALMHDTNFDNYDSASKKIKKAFDTGRDFQMTFVDRDFYESWENGVLSRPARFIASGGKAGEDRMVTINRHIEINKNMIPTLKRIINDFKNDPRFSYNLINNRFEAGQWKYYGTIDEVPGMNYTNIEEIEDKLYELTKKALRDAKIRHEHFETAISETPRLKQKAIEEGYSKDNRIRTTYERAQEERIARRLLEKPLELTARKLTNIADTASSLAEKYGGATIDVFTGNPLITGKDKGFVFSEQKALENKIDKNKFSKSDILEYVFNNQDKFDPVTKKFGIWIDDNTDAVYLDTVNVNDDFKISLEKANKSEQISIYNIKTGETLYTDYGKRIRDEKAKIDSSRRERPNQIDRQGAGLAGTESQELVTAGTTPGTSGRLSLANEKGQIINIGVEKPPKPPKPTAVSGSPEEEPIPTEAAVNLERLRVSKEAKENIVKGSEIINEEIEKVKGKPLTHDEVVEKAKEAEVLMAGVSRETTLNFEAALLKTRQQLGALAQEKELTQEFLDTLSIVARTGTDIARQLESFKIEALPEYAVVKTDIIKKLQKMGVESDKILDAAKGVDFEDPNQVADFYRTFVKPSIADQLNEFAYMNILSSPGTHIINTFSNLIQTIGLNPLTRLSTGAIDFVGSALTGKARKTYLEEIPTFYKGMFNAGPEATDLFRQAWSGKIFVERPDIRRIPTKSKLVDIATLGVGKFVLRALEGSDIFFRALIKAGERESLAMRYPQPLSDKDRIEVEKEAKRRAEYYVFRSPIDPKNKTGQGDLLSAIDKMTKAVYSFRNVPGVQWFVRFVRTPMNILKQGVEYSPIGVSTLKGAKYKQEQAGKALLGSVVFTGAMALAMNDRTTWAVPLGKNDRLKFYQSGKQPYSIKIGNRWFSYSRLGPLAYPIAMAAAIHYYDRESKTALSDTQFEKGVKALSGIMRFFSDQSYMEGVGNLVGAVRGDVYEQSRVLTNVPGQLIPLSSLQRWTNNIIDPIYRKPERGFKTQAIKENLMQSVLGLSYFLPEQKDIFGEPAKKPDRLINAFSPIRTRKEDDKFSKLFDAELKMIQKEKFMQKKVERLTEEAQKRIEKRKK